MIVFTFYPHFIHFCKCVYILSIQMVVLAFYPFYIDLSVIFTNNCVLKQAAFGGILREELKPAGNLIIST